MGGWGLKALNFFCPPPPPYKKTDVLLNAGGMWQMQMTNQQMCQMRKVWKMREIDQNSLTWQQGGRIRTDECRPTAEAPAKGFTCSVLVKLVKLGDGIAQLRAGSKMLSGQVSK